MRARHNQSLGPDELAHIDSGFDSDHARLQGLVAEQGITTVQGRRMLACLTALTPEYLMLRPQGCSDGPLRFLQSRQSFGQEVEKTVRVQITNKQRILGAISNAPPIGDRHAHGQL